MRRPREHRPARRRSAAVAGHPATSAVGRGRARLLVEAHVVGIPARMDILVSGFFEPLFYLMSIGSG